MAVPTGFDDVTLVTTVGSNSPAAGDNVFPDLDNFLRFHSAALASIYANTATNGWVSPYMPKAGGTFTGAVTGTTASFSSTLGVTGVSTLAAVGATNGTFSGTLGVTGATTLAALGATTGTFSGAMSCTTGTFAGAVTGITNLTTSGNAILGNARGDTLNVAAGAIAVGAGGNVTMAPPSTGNTLTVDGTLQTTANINSGDGIYAASEIIAGGSVTVGGSLLLTTGSVTGTTNISISADAGYVDIAGTSGAGLRCKANGQVNFTPMSQPADGAEGDVYMDSGTHKLMCHNGTTWNALF